MCCWLRLCFPPLTGGHATKLVCDTLRGYIAHELARKLTEQTGQPVEVPVLDPLQVCRQMECMRTHAC